MFSVQVATHEINLVFQPALFYIEIEHTIIVNIVLHNFYFMSIQTEIIKMYKYKHTWYKDIFLIVIVRFFF